MLSQSAQSRPGHLTWIRRVTFAFLVPALCGAVLGLGWYSQNRAGEFSENHTPLEPAAALAPNRVPDDAPVIGVIMAGRPRAYLLQALMRPDSHVCNDVIGSVPVSVTFCDVDDCVRVFTAPDHELPLDIALGRPDSSRARKMVLRVGTTPYWQDNGQPLGKGAAEPFPYAAAEFIRTTWGRWRDEHPESDLHIGNLPFAPDEKTRFAPRPERGN